MKIASTLVLLFASLFSFGQTVEQIMDQNDPPQNSGGVGTRYISESAVYSASGNFYFSSFTGNDLQIFKTNGSTTTPIKLTLPIQTNYTPFLISLNNKIFIMSVDAIMVYDETLDSTYNFTQIVPQSSNVGAAWKLTDKCIFIDSGKVVMLCTPKTGNGIQIWKTDGTSTGTSMISTIPNLSFYDYSDFIGVSIALNTYYFKFQYSKGLIMVNRTTGTITMDTVTVNSTFLELNGLIYFSGSSNNYGNELWKSNGTAAGTSMVLDLNPGSNSGVIAAPIVYNAKIYMRCNNPIYGDEYWQSDGTASGTKLVKDINANLGVVAFFNNYLYLNKNNSLFAVNLLDSTLTKSYSHAIQGDQPKNFFTFNGTLYFTLNNPQNQTDLCKLNSNDLVEKVFTIQNSTSSPNLLSIIKFWNSKFYFTIDQKMIFSDGTTSGTNFVKFLNPISLQDINFRHDVQIGNDLYLTHWTDSSILLKLNYSSTTAQILRKLPYKYSSMSGYSHQYIFKPENVNNSAIFFLSQREGLDCVLWKTNGSPAGTQQVFKQSQEENANGDYSSFYNWKGKTYFTTAVGNYAYLYQTDGTASGTKILKQNLESTSVRYVVMNDTLYFTCIDTLFACAGTASSLRAVQKFPGSYLYLFTKGNEIYVLSQANSSPLYLYATNGTIAGTRVIYNFGNAILQNPEFVEYNGQVFFRMNQSELWKTNGTTTGTVMVKSIFNFNSFSPNVLNGSLLFKGSVIVDERIMKTDGTSAGTVAVSTFNNYNGDVYSSNFLLNKNKLYFIATFEGTSKRQLYQTDGSSAGTVLVYDLLPGNNNPSDEYNYLNFVGNRLFFAGRSSTDLAELWAYNRLSGAAQKVIETIPGFASGLTDQFASVGPYLYYSNYHPSYGYELWRTDTNYNSRMIYDLSLGTYSSKPISFFKASDSLLYFQAYKPEFGYELYAIKTNKTGAKMNISGSCLSTPVSLSATISNSYNPVISYEWSINDSIISTAAQLQYLFPKRGTYKIRLVTQNTAQVKDTIIRFYQFAMNFQAAASINNSAQCLNGNLFVFTDTSKVLNSSVIQRVWKMGDGTIYQNDSIVQHTYQSAGIYQIKLIITDINNCIDSVSYQVWVYNNTISTITGNQFARTQKTSSHQVNKIDGYKYQWKVDTALGNFLSSPDSSFINIQWKDIVANAVISVSTISPGQCVKILKDTIGLLKLLTNYYVNDSLQCLSSNSFIFKDVSTVAGTNIVTRKWDMGDGTIYLNDTIVQHSYTNTGTYQVKLKLKTPQQFEDSLIQTVHVTKNTLGQVSGDDTVQISSITTYSVPHDSGNKYIWELDRNLGTIVSPVTANPISIQWGNTPGIETIRLLAFDSNMCEIVKIFPVIVKSPVGIENYSSTNMIVYPNPVKNELHIELGSDQEETSIELFNTIGQLIYKDNNIQKQTTIPFQYDPGVYYLRLKNKSEMRTVKILKEK